MKHWAWLCLLILPCSWTAYAQDNDSSQAETSSISEGNIYRFPSSTVWGKVDILVADLHDKFGVKVQGDAPMTGWTLKEEGTSRTLSRGGLTAVDHFKFLVHQPFRNSYRLTLFLDSNHEQVPLVVRLWASKEGAKGGTNADGLDDFQENPDHPYNSTVRNYYEKAVDCYSRKDNVQALSLLKKAEELDPLQPQVQALIFKIQGPTKKETGPLDKIRTAIKKGKKEQAQAQLEDFLDQNPDDEEALELKDKLEGRAHTPKTPAKHPTKAKDPSTKVSRSAETEQDRHAKADQAYNLGLDSYGKEDYGAAKKFWEETLRIEPTHLQARRNLDRLEQEHPDVK